VALVKCAAAGPEGVTGTRADERGRPRAGRMPLEMRGVWLEERRLALRDDLPAPEAPPGEAVVAVRLAGICNTDLELLRGYYPFAGVPGHEFVGVVEAAAGAEDWVGRRVVGEINAACNECRACRAGLPTHCERRTVLGIVKRDGACAERLMLPIANLHTIDDALPDEVAVFAEPTAAALEVLEQVAIGPGVRVLVVGAGKLGQLVARVLATTGCLLTVLARHPRQRALLDAVGIALAPGEPQAGAYDVAVECTGNPEGLLLARRALRPRGTLVLKSTYAGEVALDLSSIVVDELTLVGSRCGPFDEALALLGAGRLDPRDLIEARYPLAEALVAFEHAARPGALKILLQTA
jgi:2-desacetyl-2-hydroxyethyl bacteriochlorophyllide A dehydrogenase